MSMVEPNADDFGVVEGQPQPWMLDRSTEGCTPETRYKMWMASQQRLSAAAVDRDEIPPPAGPEDFGLPAHELRDDHEDLHDDGREQTSPAIKGKPEAPPIKAKPYAFIVSNKIPMRDRLYGSHLYRGLCSAVISPGGVGKSTLVVTEALARVTNRPLLGARTYYRPLRCWVWNLEDPLEEMQRKIQASCLHHNVIEADISDRLFVNGREDSLVVARPTPSGGTIIEPVIAGLVAEIKARRVDVLTIDPFVSCHQVSENDNSMIDAVAKAWGRVAGEAGCAVELVHHARKLGPDATVTADSSRGASALVDACRAVRVLNRMTEDEGKRADVENNRLFFRVLTDKGNLAPPSAVSEWYRLIGVDLGNGPTEGQGDNVQVVTRWEWPDAFDGLAVTDLFEVQKRVAEGEWRKDSQAEGWVGKIVAEVLHLDLNDAADKTRTKSLLKTWIESGALKVINRLDAGRKEREFVVVGQWANAT